MAPEILKNQWQEKAVPHDRTPGRNAERNAQELQSVRPPMALRNFGDQRLRHIAILNNFENLSENPSFYPH
jgi:hypothetical protein